MDGVSIVHAVHCSLIPISRSGSVAWVRPETATEAPVICVRFIGHIVAGVISSVTPSRGRPRPIWLTWGRPTSVGCMSARRKPGPATTSAAVVMRSSVTLAWAATGSFYVAKWNGIQGVLGFLAKVQSVFGFLSTCHLSLHIHVFVVLNLCCDLW